MLKCCALLCQWLPASFVSLGQNPGSNKSRAEFWRSDARASSARAKAWATSPRQGAALLWVGQLVCFMVHWFLVKKYAGPESWSLCLGCNPHTVSFSSPDFWGLKLFSFFYAKLCFWWRCLKADLKLSGTISHEGRTRRGVRGAVWPPDVCRELEKMSRVPFNATKEWHSEWCPCSSFPCLPHTPGEVRAGGNRA